MLIVHAGARMDRANSQTVFRPVLRPCASKNTSHSKKNLRLIIDFFLLFHVIYSRCHSHLAAMKNGKIVRDAFTFPSCCVCVVKQTLFDRNVRILFLIGYI